MKAKQIPITSGAAGGTMVTRVESNSGKLLGFIRVVHVDFTPVLGMQTMYIVKQCFNNYGSKLCHTLLDCYHYLGISTKEVDISDLGQYCYCEKTPTVYWIEQKRKERENIYYITTTEWWDGDLMPSRTGECHDIEDLLDKIESFDIDNAWHSVEIKKGNEVLLYWCQNRCTDEGLNNLKLALNELYNKLNK